MKIKFTFLISLYSFISIASLATEEAFQGDYPPEKYTVAFRQFSHEYDVVSPKGNGTVKIVYIPDFSDNYNMGEQAAASLIQKLSGADLMGSIEAVVLPGDKANMVGTLLFRRISKFRTNSVYGDTEFVILRSAEKGFIEKSIEYSSITGGSKTLNIRPDQSAKIRGKKVLLFDDVLSTGGTLSATRKLIELYGCEVIAFACVATEGDDRKVEKNFVFEEKPLISVFHLPVWKVKE